MRLCSKSALCNQILQYMQSVIFITAVFLKKIAIIIAILGQKIYTGTKIKLYLLICTTLNLRQ